MEAKGYFKKSAAKAKSVKPSSESKAKNKSKAIIKNTSLRVTG